MWSFQSSRCLQLSYSRVVFHLFSFQSGDSVHYGLLSANSVNDTSKSSTFCITYNPQFHDLPKDENEAVSLKFLCLK